MTEQETKYTGRGGARPGAGRPKKPKDELRTMKTMRATKEEWEIIKDFARFLKHDRARAERMMKTK